MNKRNFIILFLFLIFILKAQTNFDLSNYIAKLREYRYSKYLDSAKHYFNKALPNAIQKKDSVKLFYLYKHLGDAYEHHQFIDSTLLMYDICETYIPKGNYKLKSFLLNDKGYTYQLLYDYDKSAELTLEALKIAEKSGDKREIASVSVSLADGFSNLKMNKQANQYYNYSIKLAKSTNDTGMLSFAHRYFGAHLLEIKDVDIAFWHLKQAYYFSSYLKDSISMAYVWHHLADYFWLKKQTDSCFYVAKKAEGIWKRRAEYIDYSAVCAQQGKFYFDLGNYTDAEIYYKNAEKYIRNDLYFNEALFENMAVLYKKQNKLNLAFEYFFKSKKMLTQITENEKTAKVISLRVKFEADQKELLIQKEKQISLLANLETKTKTAHFNIISFILFFCNVFANYFCGFLFKNKTKKQATK